MYANTRKVLDDLNWRGRGGRPQTIGTPPALQINQISSSTNHNYSCWPIWWVSSESLRLLSQVPAGCPAKHGVWFSKHIQFNSKDNGSLPERDAIQSTTVVKIKNTYHSAVDDPRWIVLEDSPVKRYRSTVADGGADYEKGHTAVRRIRVLELDWWNHMLDK